MAELFKMWVLGSGTTQQTQVLTALACTHAKEVTPMAMVRTRPTQGSKHTHRTGKKYPDRAAPHSDISGSTRLGKHSRKHLKDMQRLENISQRI